MMTASEIIEQARELPEEEQLEIVVTISQQLSKGVGDDLTQSERDHIDRVLLERAQDECVAVPSDLEARVFRRAGEINAQVNG